jgi:3-phytase
MSRISRSLPLAAALLLSLAACSEEAAEQAAPAETPAAEPAAAAPPAGVTAVRETDPVDTAEDSADDPAIWVDLQDPTRSLVIGTAKKSGLYLYGLDGKVLQFLPEGRLNNVDLRTVRLGDGTEETVVVAASDRDNDAIALFRLDPETRQLATLGERHATDFTDPYGLCLYHSQVSDTLYLFMTDKEKGGAQWRIEGDGDAVSLTRVRDLPLATQSEGCVADDQNAVVYVAEENVGIWAFPAEPDQAAEAKPVAMIADNPKLAADIEGLAIYDNGAGGYLVASSQGNNSFAVFELAEGYAFKGSFSIQAGTVDAVSETDGIEVVATPMGPDFPQGLLVVQDGLNEDPAANQNFKLVSWKDVAGFLSLD